MGSIAHFLALIHALYIITNSNVISVLIEKNEQPFINSFAHIFVFHAS